MRPRRSPLVSAAASGLAASSQALRVPMATPLLDDLALIGDLAANSRRILSKAQLRSRTNPPLGVATYHRPGSHVPPAGLVLASPGLTCRHPGNRGCAL